MDEQAFGTMRHLIADKCNEIERLKERNKNLDAENERQAGDLRRLDKTVEQQATWIDRLIVKVTRGES